MYNQGTETVTIKLKGKKPFHHNEEVILPPHTSILLQGKGEGGTITIRKTSLKYKKQK